VIYSCVSPGAYLCNPSNNHMVCEKGRLWHCKYDPC